MINITIIIIIAIIMMSSSSNLLWVQCWRRSWTQRCRSSSGRAAGPFIIILVVIVTIMMLIRWKQRYYIHHLHHFHHQRSDPLSPGTNGPHSWVDPATVPGSHFPGKSESFHLWKLSVKGQQASQSLLMREHSITWYLLCLFVTAFTHTTSTHTYYIVIVIP